MSSQPPIGILQSLHRELFFGAGAACSALNSLGVSGTLNRFCLEFLPQCPLADPRGKEVRIVKSNFPKLADLEHAHLPREVLSASMIVQAIEDGSFDPTHYREMRVERIQTLFWVPDCIRDPDAIFRNGYKMIAGDEVYVRVYNKSGSKVKLVFTMDIKKNGSIVRTVPVTSFFTNSRRASLFVKGAPLYIRK
jgi:hypothetical protein